MHRKPDTRLDESAIYLLEMTDPAPESGVSFEEADFYLRLGQARALMSGTLRSAAEHTLSQPLHRSRLPVVHAAIRQSLSPAEPPPLLRGVWPTETYLPARKRALELARLFFGEQEAS